jgi:CrcB protein
MLASSFHRAFPIGTLIINISASFILGFFLIWTSERVLADPRWRMFIAVGFCATYSTYSSYAFETFALFENGQFSLVALNFLLTNVVCFVAVGLGAALARNLEGKGLANEHRRPSHDVPERIRQVEPNFANAAA